MMRCNHKYNLLTLLFTIYAYFITRRHIWRMYICIRQMAEKSNAINYNETGSMEAMKSISYVFQDFISHVNKLEIS